MKNILKEMPDNISFEGSAYNGNARAGKTLSLVADAENTLIAILNQKQILLNKKNLNDFEKDRLKVFSDFKLISNMELNKKVFGNYIKLSAKELLEKYKNKEKIENALILFDDFFKDVDSWNILSNDNKLFSYFFTELGKKHLILRYVVHLNSMVFNRLRNFTKTNVFCKKGRYVFIKTNEGYFKVFQEYKDYYDLKINPKDIIIRRYFLNSDVDLNTLDYEIKNKKNINFINDLIPQKYFNRYKTGEVI